MSNSINWGAGAENNSIDWGQSNCNTNDFGIMYGKSSAGETIIEAPCTPPVPAWSNLYALDYDGVNDYVRGPITGSIPKQTFTLSMWVRIDATTKHNMHFYNWVGTEGTPTNDRFSVSYSANFNRLVVQFRRGDGFQYSRQYALHDNGATGITNSTTGWVASQRGTTDSAGFTHLCFALDQTTFAVTSGIKAYWNGSQMSSITASDRNDFFTPMNCNFLSIGDNAAALPAPNSAIEGVIDEVYLYDAQLSAADVNTIYGFGRDTENTYTTNFVTAWRMENDVTDTNSLTSLTNNGATFIPSP